MTDIAAARASPRSARAKWFTAIKVALCLAVVAAVAWTLTRQLRLVDWSQVRFELGPSLLAALGLLGVSFMQLAARWTLLRAYGYPLSWRINLAVSWIPQLGKYLPGGIASVGGVVYLLRKYNVPGAVGLSVALLLDAMAVIAGLIVSTPLLFWGPVRERYPHVWIASGLMVVIGLVLLHPRVFVALLNALLRKLKRQPLASVPPVKAFTAPVLASFGQWICAGLALYFMALTITPISAKHIPFFCASAALAMTISYLMPFTPGGIGIREWVYWITLSPLIGPQAALVALVLRVLQTILEIALAAIGMMVLRKHVT
ncbi:MAG TPA: YbhN family protein [Tepidisphaeraceae bacterium]|jgi:hypothetical protein